MLNNTLFIIPARGGSKGIPGKNIKLLGSKPLIYYSIDIARNFVSNEHICVSSDDLKIADTVEVYGVSIPFIRPLDLATDEAGTYEVLLHALNYYKSKGVEYQKIVLLQPTSPFRGKEDVSRCIHLFDKTENCDLVLTVKKARHNPYSVLKKINNENDLLPLFNLELNSGIRRQDVKDVVEINGAVYVYNVQSLLNNKPTEFKNIKAVLMDEIHSTDLDEMLDWNFAEFLIEKKLV